MTENILMDNDAAIIRYDDEHNYIYHTMLRPLNHDEFREVLNAGLEGFVSNGATKWLSDDRLNDGLSKEDNEFGVSVWGPEAARAGWTHWALIVPLSTTARSSMTETVQAYHALGIRVRIFTDVDEARNWLIAQE